MSSPGSRDSRALPSEPVLNLPVGAVDPRTTPMTQAEVKAGPQGWIVVVDSQEIGPFHRVRGALNSARRQVQLEGGGEVTVRARTGEIVERQTVPTRRGLILS